MGGLLWGSRGGGRFGGLRDDLGVRGCVLGATGLLVAILMVFGSMCLCRVGDVGPFVLLVDRCRGGNRLWLVVLLGRCTWVGPDIGVVKRGEVLLILFVLFRLLAVVLGVYMQ